MLDNFSETEKYILPSFLNLLQSEDIKIDFAEQNLDNKSQFDITISPHGKKFIKQTKKIDKHFNFHSFLDKVLALTVEQYAKEKENASQS
jgi:hypothetical protein